MKAVTIILFSLVAVIELSDAKVYGKDYSNTYPLISTAKKLYCIPVNPNTVSKSRKTIYKNLTSASKCQSTNNNSLMVVLDGEKDKPNKTERKTYIDLFIAIAWPLVALITISIILFFDVANKRLVNFLKLFKKFTFPGGSIELTEAESKAFKKESEEAFKQYREEVRALYDRTVYLNKISEIFTKVVEDIKDILPPACHNSVRFALHVEDVLLAESLYQLTDYYPSGKGHGRVWSIRYGIIGKAWRSGEPIFAVVPHETRTLIKDWGMTVQEAQGAGAGKVSFAAIVCASH